MPIPPLITAIEIRKLFKSLLGISCSQPQLYYYIKVKGFPSAVKIGRPARWVKAPVTAWFEEQRKQFK